MISPNYKILSNPNTISLLVMSLPFKIEMRKSMEKLIKEGLNIFKNMTALSIQANQEMRS